MVLKFRISLIFLIFLLLFSFDKYFSQNRQKPFRDNLLILREDEEIQRQIQKRTIEFILEGVIDENTYIIGPGDFIFVNVWGEEEEEFDVMVMPEGNIIIKNVGSIKIDGLNLKRAKELIKEKVEKFYPKSEITVSLGNIRKFKVHVTGEVIKRGTYDSSPIDRLSHIILKAESFTTWADKKNIEIRHLDGTIDIVNLYKFENDGDIENNPFVRSGDIIYIPRINFSDGMIFVSGNLTNPGYYHFYKNEKVGDLIKRIDILKETTDWENSFLKRKAGSDKNKMITIPLDFINSDSAENNPEDVLLKDRDIIYLPKKINEVFVYGAVTSPGAFPFYSNMKSGDYALLAGKTDRSGSYNGIKVYKRNSNKVLKGGNIDIERGDKIEVPVKTTELTRDYLYLVGTFSTILIAAKAVGIIK